jgi:hypothetical protein
MLSDSEWHQACDEHIWGISAGYMAIGDAELSLTKANAELERCKKAYDDE